MARMIRLFLLFLFYAAFLCPANEPSVTPANYLLPPFLEGILSLKVYKNWLDHRSDELFTRDKRRKCEYALNGSKALYKQAIHQAVMTKGRTDPFTGDTLRWNLVGTWAHTKKELENMDSAQRKQFSLLPVVDHTDPYADTLELEICSWQINYCKSSSTPAEFVALCKKVLDYQRNHPINDSIVVTTSTLIAPVGRRFATLGSTRRGEVPDGVRRRGIGPLSVPAKYLLPVFLQGRCTLATYRKWLYVRARELLRRDRLLKRPYALNDLAGNVPYYKMLIHQAVNRGGQTDPFTGDSLKWELIGTWNSSIPTSHDPAVMEKFALLPTVDHIDPASDVLAFEICSFDVNKCKSSLNQTDFIAMCEQIVAYDRRPKGGH
jgi:hypothetical protein